MVSGARTHGLSIRMAKRQILSISRAFAEYDLSKGEFPITTLRPIAIKSAIKELLWIYQEQTSDLDVLEDKYGVKRTGMMWEVGDSGNIGLRYGATVKKHDIITKAADGFGCKILLESSKYH